MNKPLELEESKEILDKHLGVIKLIMSESLAEVSNALGSISVSVNNRAKCSLFHSIAIEKSLRYFHNVPGVEINEKYQSIQIVFDKKLVGRIKKLNKDNLPANSKSKRNDMIISQQLKLFPEATTHTFIDLGYKVDFAWGKFEKLLILCRMKDSIEWDYNFTGTEEAVISMPTNDAEWVKIKEEKQIKIKKTGWIV